MADDHLPGGVPEYSGNHARAAAGLLQDKEFQDVSAKLHMQLRGVDMGVHDQDNLEGDWQMFADVRWTLNHARLLHMISQYAVPARSIE